MTDKKEFLRLSGGSDFQGRADVIFGSLNLLEPDRKQETESQVLPRVPKHVPDHVLHPEKWVKYSLEDDGTQKLAGVTGDALNKHVALSFLADIHSRNQGTSNRAVTGESDVEMSEKHVFSRSNIKHKMEVDEGSPRSQIVEGVNVMREYVIGQSPAKSSKKEYQKVTVDADKNLEANASRSVVCLEHLEDQDTTDGPPENSKSDLDSGREKLGGVKFAKRKCKTRDGIRGRKSTEEHEHCDEKQLDAGPGSSGLV